jgi:hypothetical protein
MAGAHGQSRGEATGFTEPGYNRHLSDVQISLVNETFIVRVGHPFLKGHSLINDAR